METHQVRHRGAALVVESEGSGPPVLLLHGGLGHMGTLAGPRRALVAAGYRVVAVDARGMGRSSMGEAALSYGQLEEDALAVLGALDIAACACLGFSDGGIVGLRLTARAGSPLRALVTVGARWRVDQGRHLWPAMEKTDRRTLSAGPLAGVVSDYERLSPDGDFDALGRASAQMWRDSGPTGHPEDQVDAIAAPLLIAVGDRDPILSVSAALALRDRVSGSELLVLPGAGHAAFDERPELFEPALLGFLARAFKS